MSEAYVLGVDVGGTFTDLSLIRVSDGANFLHKVSSTPDDPSRAVIDGIRELLAAAQIGAGAIRYFGHGTTVATNAVITGRMAATAMIATRGFRDVLEIRRQRQPHNYDIRIDKPPPIVPRHLRYELDERVYLSDDPPHPPNPAQLEAIADAVGRQPIAAIAVCFLHSYARPEHEAIVAAALRERFPGVFVCASHQVVAEFREYERYSTTVLNAALGPVMSRYLGRLETQAGEIGLVAPKILQSNGGVASPREAGALAVRTLASGPAAGVTGAVDVAMRGGFSDIITFDVGGTSTDVCLIESGRPLIARQRDFHGYPVRFPMIDIHSVGAGGGSIAWVDEGGFLQVGPQSAGADPGPACYDLGGSEPTVTDANIVLGRLPPDALLGGRMAIRAELARRAIAERIAAPLGLSVEAAAQGILTILNENLIQAIRVISVERGFDPRSFALVAFGGAGPLLASALARELDIGNILVPEHPGLLCAHGLLAADVRADFSMTRITGLEETAASGLSAAFAELRQRAETWFDGEGIPPDSRHLGYAIDLRYSGQSHELTVPVDGGEVADTDMPVLAERFRAEHERAYGYAPGGRVQVVTYRITARTPVAGAVPSRAAPVPIAEGGAAPVGAREVYFHAGAGFVECPIYNRDALPRGVAIAGPAIIAQMDTTTVVLPEQTVTVRPDGLLLLTFRSRPIST